MRIKSTYNVDGRFLVVTFDESGPADGNYSKYIPKFLFFKLFVGTRNISIGPYYKFPNNTTNVPTSDYRVMPLE